MFGAMLSKSSTGTLHTHSAGYKFDLDVAGTSNSFVVKTLKFGPMTDAVAASDPSLDLTGIHYSNPSTYYYETSKVANEGTWDNDGDDTWTPPPSCLTTSPGTKFVVKSDNVNMYGQSRGYVVDVPIGQYQASGAAAQTPRTRRLALICTSHRSVWALCRSAAAGARPVPAHTKLHQVLAHGHEAQRRRQGGHVDGGLRQPLP